MVLSRLFGQIFAGRRNLNRNAYIDLLRAAAILPVLAGHWIASPVVGPPQGPIDLAFFHAASHGGRGVMLFFAISGFVITRAAMAREQSLFAMSWRAFYARRIARIAPLLLAVCAVGLVLIAAPPPHSALAAFTIRNPAAVFDWRLWTSIATFTFNWWRIVSAHVAPGWGLHWDVLWSLAVEEQFYVAFPVLFWLAGRRERLLAILVALIVACASLNFVLQLVGGGPGSQLYQINSFRGFYLIAIGIGAAIFAPRIVRVLPSGSIALGGGALVAGFVLPENWPFGIFIGVGAALLMAASIGRSVPRSSIVRSVSRIGELSYGLYLLHPVVLYAVGPLAGRMGTVPGYAAFAASVILVAAGSYHVFERPADRVIRRLLLVPGKETAAATA